MNRYVVRMQQIWQHTSSHLVNQQHTTWYMPLSLYGTIQWRSYFTSKFTDLYHYTQPLPTKLVLRKKRAREGKSTDEIEHFPAPSAVTVRRGSKVSVEELIESQVRTDWSFCVLKNRFWIYFLFSNENQMLLVGYRVMQAPGWVLQRPNVKEYIMEALLGSTMLFTMIEITLVVLRMTWMIYD